MKLSKAEIDTSEQNDGGNIVNVASQSGTSAFSKLSSEMKQKFKDPDLNREKLEDLAKKFCGS